VPHPSKTHPFDSAQGRLSCKEREKWGLDTTKWGHPLGELKTRKCIVSLFDSIQSFLYLHGGSSEMIIHRADRFEHSSLSLTRGETILSKLEGRAASRSFH
jgi:hypothetical protein